MEKKRNAVLFAIGLLFGGAVTAGMFDEAAQYQQSRTAWCVDICNKDHPSEIRSWSVYSTGYTIK